MLLVRLSKCASIATRDKGGIVSRFARRIQRVSAAGGELYLTPASGSYSSGTTVTVTIKENSGSTPVNAVQANLTYPSSQLQFQSINTSTSPFTTTLQNSGGSGTVQIGVGALGSSVTGDAIIAIVTFTVIGTGTAAVQFAAGSGIAQTSDSTDICKKKTGSSYTLS